MKSLREWILEQRKRIPAAWEDSNQDSYGPDEFAGWRDGWLSAMDVVLAELRAREDAERGRANENVNAQDGYVGEILDEKEGGPNDA